MACTGTAGGRTKHWAFTTKREWTGEEGKTLKRKKILGWGGKMDGGDNIKRDVDAKTGKTTGLTGR